MLLFSFLLITISYITSYLGGFNFGYGNEDRATSYLIVSLITGLPGLLLLAKVCWNYNDKEETDW